MAKREFFPCYHSYFKKCEKLSDQELGRLFRALMKYSSTGERQELAGRESIAFDFMADDIDRAEASYREKCEVNARNGSRGGRPRKQSPSPKPNGFEKSQYEEKYEDKDKTESEGEKLPPSPSSRGSGGNAAEEDWGFGPELAETLRAWLRYKQEKRQAYRPEGMRALVAEARENAERSGEDRVAAAIRNSMSANYQGIVWDRLPRPAESCIAQQPPREKSWTELAREMENN